MKGNKPIEQRLEHSITILFPLREVNILPYIITLYEPNM